MPFTPLSSGSRSDAVREQLQAAIAGGEYRPGDKLPTEGELAAEFGVSRVSVREALRTLQALGLVEVHHGRGSFVTRGPGDRYVEPFASWLQVHRDEIVDLSKVRGALDELAAAEAATSGTAPQLVGISDLHEQFSAAARTPDSHIEELVELDVSFHEAIADASGSALLTTLLSELNTLFTDSRRAAFGLSGRALQSASEHAAIVAAIQARDPDGARQAAARHLASTRTTFTDPAFLRELAEVTDTTETEDDSARGRGADKE